MIEEGKVGKSKNDSPKKKNGSMMEKFAKGLSKKAVKVQRETVVKKFANDMKEGLNSDEALSHIMQKKLSHKIKHAIETDNHDTM